MEKSKKRTLFIIIGGMVVLFMIISGFGFVAAWGPCGGLGRGLDRGFHERAFNHGLHGPDFADFLLWRMDRRVKELDLSEAQEAKYREVRSFIERHMAEGMEKRKEMMEAIHREILSEDPDIRFITGALKEKLGEISGSVEEALDLFAGFYESLDSAQREKILGPVRERIGLRTAQQAK